MREHAVVRLLEKPRNMRLADAQNFIMVELYDNDGIPDVRDRKSVV